MPRSKFADLQDYDELIACAGNSVHVTVPASSIVLLTTDYTDHKPAAITGICAEDGTVTWEASTEAEHRYYRVYKGDSADFVPTKEIRLPPPSQRPLRILTQRPDSIKWSLSMHGEITEQQPR